MALPGTKLLRTQVQINAISLRGKTVWVNLQGGPEKPNVWTKCASLLGSAQSYRHLTDVIGRVKM